MAEHCEPTEWLTDRILKLSEEREEAQRMCYALYKTAQFYRLMHEGSTDGEEYDRARAILEHYSALGEKWSR
jgi:hypothetical protein